MEKVEVKTGELYGSIWNQLSDEAFEELSNLHWNKFVTAGFGDGFLKGRVCLDAGCGSGRAVRSMLKACAGRVVAVDVGEECITNTKKRNTAYASRLNVARASVLNLPFPNDYFDFVHCDGVLHHTTDPFGGLQELRRVAKPGAPIFFGLYGSGGVLNFAIYSARRLSPFVPRDVADRVLSVFTADPIKHYVILDCFYVPIREKYRPAQIEDWARGADIVNLRRVAICVGYRTLMERITKDYSSLPRWFSGEGYLMYAAEKPLRPSSR